AYDRFLELSGQLPSGPSLKSLLAKLIQSEAYQDMPDGDSGVKGTRLNALGKIVQAYRERAKRVLLLENQAALVPLIKARQKEARGAFIENRQRRLKGEPGARELLGALTGSH
ncbi:hypothetical protein AB4144_54955, partial [Rhizobiaceae sp. 2RAB30]